MTVFDFGVKFGLGFTLGLVQGLFIALVLFWIINRVVEYVWAKTTLSKYKFKKLPEQYKSLELNYIHDRKVLVATATVVVGGVEHIRSRSAHYLKKDHDEAYVTNLQLSLMREISQEFPNAVFK